MNKKWMLHVGAFLCAVLLLALVLCLIPPSEAPESVQLVKGTQEKIQGFYPNLTAGDKAEIDFISSIQRPEQITIFGSSEFSGSEYCPFNFFPSVIGKPAMGLGHAHHQLMSILGELAAAEPYLENSKITVLISPTWFNTSGTNSSAFIEFMRPNFLKRIVSNPNLDPFYKNVLGKNIQKNYREFSGVSFEMDELRDSYLKNEGLFYQKWMSAFRGYVRSKFAARYFTEDVDYKVELGFDLSSGSEVNWKSVSDSLQRGFTDSISTNQMFVNDDYFQKYLLKSDGTIKSGKFKPVDVSSNQEFEDFRAVVRLLAEKGADCSFVILPLNPHFYNGMENATELITHLTAELDANEIPYLNMYTKGKEDYSPGILKDVMHVGDYGWMQINEFLNQQYYE